MKRSKSSVSFYYDQRIDPEEGRLKPDHTAGVCFTSSEVSPGRPTMSLDTHGKARLFQALVALYGLFRRMTSVEQERMASVKVGNAKLDSRYPVFFQ